MARGRQVLALLALVAGASPARAEYCRTKACDNMLAYDDIWQEEPDPPCVRDPVNCVLEGQPLYWPQRCISFSVQRDGSKRRKIDLDTARAVVQASFDAWLNADCGEGATPSFAMVDYSPENCATIEYNQDGGNANVFLFRDDEWPHDKTALALTTVTYNIENARIYDADVEINSAGMQFTTTDVAEDVRYDLQSVLTHECGHFLGLAHDADPDATMYARYDGWQTEPRTLEADDIAGICDIFPPTESVNTELCEPRHGFSRECGGGANLGGHGGCGVSRTGRSDTSALAVAALFGLGLVGRRLRRGRLSA